ncbi:hypothetical protein [Mesorhizobium amorphae]|uniref:hypothetical protein n=1 Tax=Mesorhizobium amorphae TaxID=71433 RepID=UPI001185B8B0|nr:hypothetical protein [Mesorhizobium amorphae]
MRTLLLDPSTWDLTINAAGNIAVAEEPYALAQDAASAIRLFQGELYFDTRPGIPYFPEILGEAPPISLMKAWFVRSAMTVPGVVSAVAYISEWTDRTVRGQVQIKDSNGNVTAASF